MGIAARPGARRPAFRLCFPTPRTDVGLLQRPWPIFVAFLLAANRTSTGDIRSGRQDRVGPREATYPATVSTRRFARRLPDLEGPVVPDHRAPRHQPGDPSGKRSITRTWIAVRTL